ncbi:FlgB family protein [Falsirhodobacter algicola]|uniref:FlgB family protein n=1 Tax=Falsirhodobacter algicola TaxID=2692330 RepID=A0A8J8SKI0_9RHOB|nr:FlgB family protein [Falsirhodobacter algicola]QUS35935.1 FlgB family protein [Falsirhodobacter algicola]
MFDMIILSRMAQAMAQHAGERQALAAQNVANADTPGFKARDLAPFADIYEGGALRTTRPAHLTAVADTVPAVSTTAMADPNGNTVSLETEMLRAADIKQEHDIALTVYRATTDILRTALGRG